MADRISWTWRHAVIKTDLKSTTKHVLLTLSCFMNDMGKGCYPTIRQLAEACSLSPRATCQHLEIAAQHGWIKRQEHGFRGQNYRNYEYEAAWPDVCTDDTQVESEPVYPEAGLVYPRDKDLCTEGTLKVPNTPPDNEEGTKPTKGRLSYVLAFEEFWKAWKAGPNDPKKPAYARWKKISADDHDRLMASLPAYQRYLRENNHLKCHAQTYINQRRWEGFETQASGPEMLTVERGSPQFDAWMRFKKRNGIPTRYSESKGVMTVPTEYPPVESERAS